MPPFMLIGKYFSFAMYARPTGLPKYKSFLMSVVLLSNPNFNLRIQDMLVFKQIFYFICSQNIDLKKWGIIYLCQNRTTLFNKWLIIWLISTATTIIDTAVTIVSWLACLFFTPLFLLQFFPLPVPHVMRNKAFQSLSPCLASCLLI